MAQQEKELSFKDYFVPLTKLKAIHFICIIGLIVFCNSLFNPFILDDFPQIVSNPDIKQISSIPSSFTHSMVYPGSFSLLHMYYKPLLFTTYAFLYAPFGGNPFPFHLVQICLHLANAVLVFLLFSRFFKRGIAFFLGLIFLVHPLNSETVVYIANMQDTLFVFWGLSALLMVLSKPKKMKWLGIGTLFLLSLLSKETGVVFILMAVIWSWIIKKINRKSLAITLVVVLMVYGLLRYIASFDSDSIMSLSLIQRESLWTRMLSVPKIIFYYLSQFFLPLHLATGQEWFVRQLTLQDFWLPVIVDVFAFLCMLGGFFVVRHSWAGRRRPPARQGWEQTRNLFASHFEPLDSGIRRNDKKRIGNDKLYLFFALWFCLGLGIHLQIAPLDLTVADRWFYFPMIGLLGMLGVLFNEFLHKKIRPTALAVGFLCIGILVVLTIIRNSQWQTPMKLYSHDVIYAGESPVLYSYYGALLIDNGEYDKAKLYLERSISLDPQIGSNLINLAVWYEHKKDFASAKALYWKQIKINGTQSSYTLIAYQSLARISLFNEKNPKEAKRIAKIALTKFPSDSILKEYLTSK
jgi:hypothetical protein